MNREEAHSISKNYHLSPFGKLDVLASEENSKSIESINEVVSDLPKVSQLQNIKLNFKNAQQAQKCEIPHGQRNDSYQFMTHKPKKQPFFKRGAYSPSRNLKKQFLNTDHQPQQSNDASKIITSSYMTM